MVNRDRSSIDSCARLAVPPARRSITQIVHLNACSEVSQLATRIDDLPARGHHVLDDHQLPVGDVSALGQLAGAVGLDLFAYEQRREP